MIRTLFVLAACGVLLLLFVMVCILHAQNVTVSADGSHVQFGAQYAAAQFTYPIKDGMIRHSVSIHHTGTISTVTTLVEAGDGNGNWVTIGTSSLLSDTISWTGSYTIGRVTYSNVSATGTPVLNGDYYGQTQNQSQSPQSPNP